MRLSPSHNAGQLGQSIEVFQRAVEKLLLACRQRFPIGLKVFPSRCWCAVERGHVELLQHAFHVRSISTPKKYFSFVLTMSSSIGFVVTSLLSFSRCRLRSVRTSVMVWRVPANNKSSTWNASDLRFVVRVHRHVSSMFATKPHFLRTCSRCSCQRLAALLRPPRLFCRFQITVRLLFSGVSAATQVLALRTPRHRPSCSR